MAVKYSVASGGFVQDSVAAAKYVFELSGEIDVPVALTLPYQHVKSAFTIGSATAVFSTAGSATYTLTVTSTDNAGANSVTHINAQTLTPSSGGKLVVSLANASVGADRLLRVSITRNSGTPSTDFTFTLEG